MNLGSLIKTNCDPNDNDCIYKENCTTENTILITSICLICITVMLLIKIFWSLNHSALNSKNKLRIFNIVTIVITIILVSISIISPSFPKCKFNNGPGTTSGPTSGPTPGPTSGPTPGLSDKLITVLLNNNLNLNEAKELVCNSTSKCISTDDIYVKSFRNQENLTQLSFITTENISQDDIRLSNNIINVQTSDNIITPKVKISIMDFTEYVEPEISTLIPPTIPPTEPPRLTLPPVASSPPEDNSTINVCHDYNWQDINGNGCDYYKNRTICNRFGIDPDFAQSQTTINCTDINNQQDCEIHKSLINNQLCSWSNNDNSCSPNPISAVDACCTCGGGFIVEEPAPTSAPTPEPTPAPTPEPTPAPTPAPTQEPLQTFAPLNILAIEGLVEMDTSGYKNWKVPLYYYKLTNYDVPEGSEKYIQQVFLGKVPARMGSYPKFNSVNGKFESMPNAIVPVEASEIEKPDGIDIRTEPVEGMDGYYYLFLRSSFCEDYMPVYTQPTAQLNPLFAVNYFSLIDTLGNPVNENEMLGCSKFDYDCICEGEGKWNSNGERTISYPSIPPALYENCPTTPPQSYENEYEEELNKTKHPYENLDTSKKNCRVGIDLEVMTIRNMKSSITVENTGEVEYNPNEEKMQDNDVFYGFENINEMRSVCPTQYDICADDAECLAELNKIQQKWEELKTILDDDNFELAFNDLLNNSFEVNNLEKLHNLKSCLSEDVIQSFQDEIGSCDFVKNYYKYCKFGEDNKTFIGLLSNLEGGASRKDILDIFNSLIFEPLCMITTTQRGGEKYKKFFEMYKIMLPLTLSRDPEAPQPDFNTYDFDAHPTSVTEYATRGYSAWNEIQKNCCGVDIPEKTYKPLDPNDVYCEPTDSGACVIL